MESFDLGSAHNSIEQNDTFSAKCRTFFPKVVLIILASAYTLEISSQWSLKLKFKLKFKYISLSLQKKCQIVSVTVSEKQNVHKYVEME